ncbi:MAG TPA: hypothetical protein VN457_03960, partial [Chlamydiales bacterium]|nr:hypothetical protein [Chlamydiales bacterium]
PTQLLVKELASGKTVFHIAVANGDLKSVIALKRKEKSLLTLADNYGNLPIHIIAQKAHDPKHLDANQVDIAKYIIKKSTTDKLATTNNKGMTAVECALECKNTALVAVLLQPLIKALQEGKPLTENLWNMVAKNELEPNSVTLIINGIKTTKSPFLQGVSARFEALSKGDKTKNLQAFERLRLALFLERNFPANAVPDPAHIVKDLARTKFSPTAADVVVEQLQGVIQKGNVQAEPRKTLNAVVARFNETKALGLKAITANEALITAFIMEYEVPKVQRVAQSVFAAPGNIIPEGWMVLRDNERISVVTGHVLGTGTFKKASVVVQAILQPDKTLALKEEAAVYLQPLAGASDAEKQEIVKEIEVFKKLNGMNGIVNYYTVR